MMPLVTGWSSPVPLEYSIVLLTCAVTSWLVGLPVLLKIVYVLVRRLLGLAVLVFRGDRAKDAELLVLRHVWGDRSPHAL